MVPEKPPRARDLLPLVAATAVCLAMTAWSPLSLDLGWILDFGRRTVEDGALQRQNLRSFLAPDAPVVLHEWLFAVLSYRGFEAGGAALLLAVRQAVIVALLAGVDLGLRSRVQRPAARLAALLAVAFTLIPAVQLYRPQLATLLGLAVVVAAVLGGGRGLRLAAALIFLPWANLHGGFVAGLAIFIFCLLIRVVEDRDLPLWEWAGLSALAAGLTLLNPYGIELWTHTFHHVSDDVRLLNAEWQPLWRAGPLYPFERVALVGFAAALLLALPSLRRRDLLLWALLGLGVGAGLWASRNVRLAPILLAAPVGVSVDRLLARSTALSERLDRLSGLTSGAVAALFGLLLAMSAGTLWRFGDYQGPNPGTLLWGMRQAGLRGAVWADINWAGTLLWVLPEVQVACDGRNVAAYPEEVLRLCTSLAASEDPAGRLRQLPAEWALLAEDHPLVPALEGWARRSACSQGYCLWALQGQILDLPEPAAPVWPSDLLDRPAAGG